MTYQCLLLLGMCTGNCGVCFKLFHALSSLSEERSTPRHPGPLVPPPPPPGPPPPDLVEYNVIESSAVKSVRFSDQSVGVLDSLEKPSFDDKTDSANDDSEGETSSDEESEPEAEEQSANASVEVQKPMKIPPGPPPGQPPTLPQAPPPAPPGPPPLFGQTFPPRFNMPPAGFGSVPRPLMAAQIPSHAVLSAPPTRIGMDAKPPSVVISAQPQLRNMTAEVTKFMPTSLRVRRDQPKSGKPKLKLGQQEQNSGRGLGVHSSTGSSGVHVQGDAYDTFMHEMQDLL